MLNYITNDGPVTTCQIFQTHAAGLMLTVAKY